MAAEASTTKTECSVLRKVRESKPEGGSEEKDFKQYEAKLVDMAIIAEKAERYDDMCDFLTEVVDSKKNREAQLEENERNLLSVAFKNVVGGLRSSWRALRNDPKAEENTHKELTESYCGIVENELEQKCLDVLAILEKKLIPTCAKATEKESHVFFLKMTGDYYRYLAEFRSIEKYKKSAAENYEAAYNEAKEHLAETHPTRLGLALNYSVCHYEILKQQSEACALAKRAFDEAIQKLDTLNDANYKDSTLIMQLLRDNLTLWTAEADEQGSD